MATTPAIQTRQDISRYNPQSDPTHLAFSLDEGTLEKFTFAIQAKGITIWKQNTGEGAPLYFLDPDKHKLEVHVGSLESRLAALKEQPYENLELFI
jgi:hypothetical protein